MIYAVFYVFSVTHLYTKWTCGEEVHTSDNQIVKKNKNINFCDHHSLPLSSDIGPYIIGTFQEGSFQIEVNEKYIILYFKS